MRSEVLCQFLSKLHKETAHRVRVVHTLQKARSELGTPMRHVHAVRRHQNQKVVADMTQMLYQLDLVISVVHEPLIENGRGRRSLQQHIGFLRKVDHALQPSQIALLPEEPRGADIVLVVTASANAHVGEHVRLLYGTHARANTPQHLVAVLREEFVPSTNETPSGERQSDAGAERAALRQDGAVVVEEHGDDDGDLLAVQHGRTQASEGGKERAYGSRRARTTTRRPDVEIEHDVVRGARVADADVAKLVDGEHARLLGAVAHEVENDRHAWLVRPRAQVRQELGLLRVGAEQHDRQVALPASLEVGDEEDA